MAKHNTRSPYDLSASVICSIKQHKRERIKYPTSYSQRVSPYDLSAHGGLASLAEKVKLKKFISRL